MATVDVKTLRRNLKQQTFVFDVISDVLLSAGLQDDCPVLHLSLRYCGITALGAKFIGDSLGSASRQNTRLLSLDLAGNHVSDAGATHLAGGLRLNRCLLVLNLAGNAIGDAGATEMATVLSAFELTHDEVVQRRRLQQMARQIRPPSRQLSGTKLIGRGISQAHPRTRKRGASPAAEHSKTAAKSPSGKTAKSIKQQPADDSRPKKDKSATTRQKKYGQTGRGLELFDSGYALDQISPSMTDMRLTAHPLLSVTVLRESTAERPTTLVRGNRTLISLNLSRNEIGQAGMTALLDAVLPLSRDTQAAGLLRLAVHSNRVTAAAGLARAVRSTEPRREQSEVDTTARYLSAAISLRDPLLRHHSTSTKSLPGTSASSIKL